MELFREILQEMKLLMESTDVSSISDAISNCKKVVIKYDGVEHTGHTDERTICPVVYGILNSGNPAVRAYQLDGDTASVRPEWKLFLLDGILKWENTEESFNPQNLKGLNPDGDSFFTTIYTMTKNQQPKQDKEEPQFGPNPVTKKEVEIGNDTGKEYTGDEIIQRDMQKAKTLPNNIDNNEKPSYIPNKEEIPAGTAQANVQNTPRNTEPVTKDEVGGDNNVINTQPTAPTPNNQPIMANDLETNNNTEDEKDDLTKAYNNLMERWNKLQK